MASSSSSSSSHLNSTCGLLAVLDLNDEQVETMEAMDTDPVVDVPDTPDRLSVQFIGDVECVPKESTSSLSSHLWNSDYMEEKQVKALGRMGELVNENGHDKGWVIRRKNLVSDYHKSCTSQNDYLFRKAAIANGSSEDIRHLTSRHVDKGKTTRITTPNTFACQVNNVVPDLTEHNGQSRNHLAEDMRKMSVSNACNCNLSINCIMDSPKNSRLAFMGKETIDEIQGLGLSKIHGKGVNNFRDTRQRYEKQVYAPPPSPRVGGQKRLVRNGCISPHNIATRGKQSADQHDNCFKIVEKRHSGNSMASDPPGLIDIDNIVAGDNNRDKKKGKGVIIDSRTSHDNNDARIVHLSSSNLEGSSGARDAKVDAFGFFEVLNGWRSTRNHSRRNHETIIGRQNTIGGRNHVEIDYAGDTDAAQRASTIECKKDQTAGPSCSEITFTIRQKKQELTSNNNSEFSISEIRCLDLSGQSSNSSSSRFQGRQFRGMSDPVIEIDELSPSRNTSEDLDTKARQVEDDERLARELQEQLYGEVPFPSKGEIDEYVAYALQQEEDAFCGSRGVSYRRGSWVSHSHRQPRSQSSDIVTNRRGTHQARVSNSTRLAQLRSRDLSQSRLLPSGRRHPPLPLDMDLNTRHYILEALEAAVGDIDDIFQAHRDFNENDYEMLLALDENNHQHAVASVNQINRLPQFTVQTNTVQEACAICLEIPTVGDIIRHLPCLHKFHKDCIDPWLHRSISCPVCKSSIT